MARVSMDGLEGLVQEVFADKAGLKVFLEALLQRVMSAEVAEHVGAEASSLPSSFQPREEHSFHQPL